MGSGAVGFRMMMATFEILSITNAAFGLLRNTLLYRLSSGFSGRGAGGAKKRPPYVGFISPSPGTVQTRTTASVGFVPR